VISPNPKSKDAHKLRFCTCLCLSLLAFTSLGVFCPIRAQTQKRVLVLYSTRRDTEISKSGDRDLAAIIAVGLKEGIDYYAEYLDVPRSSAPGYLPGFRDFLRVKYRGKRFDAVIAVMNVALGFVSQYRNELFPEAPVIFLAQDPSLQRLANSAGLIIEPDLTKTLTLVLTLQPDTRQVFVITGASDRDKYYDDLSRKQFRTLGSRIDFT
jgi:hypothetical protein